jgi:hypothetical protein
LKFQCAVAPLARCKLRGRVFELIVTFEVFFFAFSGSLSFLAALCACACACPNYTLLRIQREGSGGFDHNFLILLAAGWLNGLA